MNDTVFKRLIRQLAHSARRRLAPTDRVLSRLIVHRHVVLLTIFALAACTPAETPEQLQFTPGAPFVVTQNTFTTDDFSLRYPDGWRIVTGPADAPQAFTFVSPDNCAIILVAVGGAEPITSQDCPDVDFQTSRREITLDDLSLTVAGSAPDGQWEMFESTFESVARSLQPAALRE